MMKGGIGNILKQAQAVQENLRKAQEELAAIEVTGSSGGGLVSVTMTCRHDVKRVQIAPELLKDDKEVLEDLIAAAINDAVRKVEQTTQQKMSGLTSGLNIPGLNLPF
jgi:DNA-binding YbaB/EbfC family protein